ncbi:MAG: winged helix-turn-helix domain-containing protein [Candidatus Acidiferrales bacterium]
MSTTVRFDCYEVDLPAGELYKSGIKINLRDKSFQVLAALLEHPGEVVTREALRQQLWRDAVFVDFDNNLNTAVARLREALCDSADHPRFIETLPKRGYRFLKSVSEPLRAPESKATKRIRLLVLPFLNLSGDQAQEYFSDAVTDEVITALAGLAPQQLAVIARTTAMHYKGSPKGVTRIGHDLRVDYVVEGSVYRTDDHVGVNVQLIQVSDQTHLFAKKFNATLRGLFNLHGSIAEAIAAHIDVSPPTRLTTAGSAPVSTARKPSVNLAAYNEYIRARYLMGNLAPENLTTARGYLQRAITHDPEFALAYDALAETDWYLGYGGFVSPRQAFANGIIHALRAIEIDNERAETHALLGQFHKLAEYNWSEVEREMALALKLDPNSPVVRMRYAVSGLMPHGRVEEAASELERSLDLDPLSSLARFWLGIMFTLGRRYEHAFEEGQKILDLDPNYSLAHYLIACSHRYQKKFEKAIASQRRAVELSGGSALMLGWLGLALAESGNVSETRDVLLRLHGMARERYVPPSSFAWIHLGLGEIDKAFAWLGRAVDECDQLMMPIKTYGFLDPIRSDPRFAVLLRRMNLESGHMRPSSDEPSLNVA